MSFNPPPLPPSYGPLQVWWAQVLDALRAELGAQALAQQALTEAQGAQADATQALSDAVDALADAAAAATDAANAATAAATAATAAAGAQSTADTVQRDTSIAMGYVIPGVVLSASDAGATATITIAAHTRRYGDIADVGLPAGSITGLNFLTRYYVYYDQPSREGGVGVTYLATDNPNVALPQKAVGRHLVGDITTPADGSVTPTTGGAAPPSGGGRIAEADIGSTS